MLLFWLSYLGITPVLVILTKQTVDMRIHPGCSDRVRQLRWYRSGIRRTYNECGNSEYAHNNGAKGGSSRSGHILLKQSDDG